jgi:shikimate kinase
VIDGAATLRRDLLKPRLRPSSPQAHAYNPRMNPSANLILVGPMGAGKTCIGQRLAALCGLRLLDADHEIERDSGATVTEIFEREGETGFRARESAMLARLLDADGVVLATGGGAVLDANNRALLRGRGFVVHLQASVEQQLQRLAHDRTRPLLARPDREQVLHELALIRTPLYAEAADLEFDSADLDADTAALQLATLLAQRWQRIGAAA